MTERILEHDGLRLAWRERRGPGIPVVFISGGPGMPDYLGDVSDLLTGRWVVRYDQRGTGGSVAIDDDYSCAAHVADLELLRLQLGVEQLALFGHSWGGCLAQLYATEHPDRVERLFLLSASTGIGPEWAEMERAVLAWNRKACSFREFLGLGSASLLAMVPGEIGQRALERMFGQVWLNYLPPTLREPVPPEVLAGIGQRTVFRTKADVARLPKDTLDRVLPTAEFPVRVIYGENDIYGDRVDQPRARLPHAEFEIWEETGHLAWIEQPERFADSLRAFFRP
jgi:proline iminopeptidase